MAASAASVGYGHAYYFWSSVVRPLGGFLVFWKVDVNFNFTRTILFLQPTSPWWTKSSGQSNFCLFVNRVEIWTSPNLSFYWLRFERVSENADSRFGQEIHACSNNNTGGEYDCRRFRKFGRLVVFRFDARTTSLNFVPFVWKNYQHQTCSFGIKLDLKTECRDWHGFFLCERIIF